MNDIQALEAACIAAPDDDAPRLVLADKLAESGCLLGEAIARNRTLFTICRLYSQFNRWEWPKDYWMPKPDGYDELPSRRQTPLPASDKFTLQHDITTALRTLIGERTRLIYHNQIHRGGIMDDAAFEEWWRGEVDTSRQHV